MKYVWRSALAACLGFMLCATASAQDYTLGFSGPESFSGADGAVVSGDYTCDLTHAGDGPGAQGWSIGVTAEGGQITSATTDGTTTAGVFDGGFNRTTLTEGADNEGAVSAVVLCFGCPAVLPPNATGSMLAIGVEWTIPAGGGSGTLKYKEGLVGAGQPVEIVITEAGVSAPFSTLDLVVALNGAGASCCAAEYRFAFSSAALQNTTPGEGVADDSENCSGTGALEIEPGAQVFANAISIAEVGIQGWSIGIECRGDVTITEVTTDGTSGAPVPVGRFDGGFNKTNMALPENNDGKRGVTSAVVLCFGCPATLEPMSTESILAMTVTGAAGATGEIAFAEGLRGLGQPVENVLTVAGTSAPICNIDTVAVALQIAGGGGLTLGPFIRGDANDDSIINVSDPIWIINELFRAGEATGCQVSADTNSDGMIDIDDAVFMLTHLFEGGSAPSAPYPACGTVPDVAGGLTCEADTSCP